MRNLRYLYLSLGFLLIVLGGINFYNQDYPPNIKVFGQLYRYLHGIEKKKSDWDMRSYDYNVSRKKNKFIYHLKSFEIHATNTVFHFEVSKFREYKNNNDRGNQDTNLPLRSEKSSTDSNFFPNPVMVVCESQSPDEIYLALRKVVKIKGNDNLLVDIYFPEIDGESGDIRFWVDYKGYEDYYDWLFWLAVPKSYDPTGANVWIILFF